MTTTETQVAMDGSPATSEVFNRKNDPGVVHGPYGEIKWQLGPVMAGSSDPSIVATMQVNGATIEDVVEVCIERLRGFQRGPFSCRENALAITAFEEGRNWLLQRTRDRQEQGVEGTNAPHQS